MLVIVLVALLSFGCEIQAKSDQSIDKNRRDAQSFYDQIKAASLLNFLCDLSSCATLAKQNVCPGFCKRNEHLINRAMTATSKCLRKYSCNLKKWNLSQVNIPIGIEGYDGVCSLLGNVTVSGGSDVKFSVAENDEHDSTSFPSYKINSHFTLTYSGFSVTCSPFTSSSGGSGNGLLSQILNKGSSRSKFSASVTVTQAYYFNFVYSFFTSVTYLTGCSAITSVKLGSGVPAEYKKRVKAVVNIQLDNINLINDVCNNYVSNTDRALRATFNTTCFQENCEAAQTITVELKRDQKSFRLIQI